LRWEAGSVVARREFRQAASNTPSWKQPQLFSVGQPEYAKVAAIQGEH
jgi:hypothetical protein